MGLGELFLLAVGLAMDAFAVAVCKGLSIQKLKLRHALLVGLWFGVFQALMPAVGYLPGWFGQWTIGLPLSFWVSSAAT